MTDDTNSGDLAKQFIKSQMEAFEALNFFAQDFKHYLEQATKPILSDDLTLQELVGNYAKFLEALNYSSAKLDNFEFFHMSYNPNDFLHKSAVYLGPNIRESLMYDFDRSILEHKISATKYLKHLNNESGGIFSTGVDMGEIETGIKKDIEHYENTVQRLKSLIQSIKSEDKLEAERMYGSLNSTGVIKLSFHIPNIGPQIDYVRKDIFGLKSSIIEPVDKLIDEMISLPDEKKQVGGMVYFDNLYEFNRQLFRNKQLED